MGIQACQKRTELSIGMWGVYIYIYGFMVVLSSLVRPNLIFNDTIPSTCQTITLSNMFDARIF